MKYTSIKICLAVVALFGGGSANNKMGTLADKMSHAQIDKAQDMPRRCLENGYMDC
jgi:hypothetical protein